MIIIIIAIINKLQSNAGWCYIHAHYSQKSIRLLWMFFSYELWVSGSMLFILTMVVFFCMILCAHRVKASPRMSVTVQS